MGIHFLNICMGMNTLQPMILFGILSQLLFGYWNTHIERGFPPLPLPHLVVSRYSYHERWLLNLRRHCHSSFDLPKYGTTCIVHDNICNDNCHLGENMITYEANINKQLHSPCHKDLWLFYFSFQLLFDILCLGHYNLSLETRLEVL